MLSDSVAISVPLRSDDETETNINNDPPAYENPQLDFSGEWKDRGFAIAFWIHTIAVILVGLILGLPTLLSSMKESSLDELGFKRIIYSLVGAAVVSGIVSFLALFALQRCAGQLIKCSFLILTIIQILLAVALYFVLPPLCFIPGAFILFTLIYISCVRNSIAFAEAHLQAGCASLRSHSSLIFVALVMLIVEFLWLVFWFLMFFGVAHFVLVSLGSTSSSDLGAVLHFVIGKIVFFLLLLSCYWGAITFGNIIHFITACTVGDWWFTSGGSGHYGIDNSIKRAFTTNLGTICFGSLFEAIIKSLRFFTGGGRRKNCLTCIIDYMLQILEKLIGYLNEWAFTFAALTGQGYVQAGRSFIELFKKRGWTAIINDSIVGITLMTINLGIGLISAVAGGTIMYYMKTESSGIGGLVVSVISASFLIGILMSSIITTLLKSSVRTVFVCFALNPAALGATHPDHLQKLTKVWHKFYPQEFASSGYANEFKEPIV